ncbi:MAG: GNAT family N-acetyltransferase [Anaerolineales bacterium]|nr:GNAT family N-acetyltransferase [Anaerolineales bacterium]
MMTSQTSTHLTIRSAAPDDAELVVRLIGLSMGVLADYLFGGVRTPVDEILAGLCRFGANRYSWSRTDIAEWNGETVGMVISFPGGESLYRNIATGFGLFKLCNFFDVMRLAVRALSIASGIETKRDEYYIANLAVLPQYQGRGIGSGLMAYVEGKAKIAGLRKCSLIVDTEKPVARRLYEHIGYQVVYTKTYVGEAEDAHAGYFRLVKDLV